MRKKMIAITSTAMLLSSVIFNNSIWAKDSQKLFLNINGDTISDQEPVIIGQTTFVPIQTVGSLPNTKISWESQSKTVLVTNTVTKEVVKLIVGQKTAYKDNKRLTVSAPVRLIKGTTYVPFRFVGEALDAKVLWDQKTRTISIYNTSVDASLTKKLESKDLSVARNAVLSLPRISSQKHLTTTDEGHSTTYYFPYGEAKRFFISDQGVVQYIEVKDNIATTIWEGVVSSKQDNKNDIIPNIVHSVSKEWGKRPTFKGKISYFTDKWMEEAVSYGLIDENGQSSELGNIAKSNSKEDIIKEISGEMRKD